MISKEKLDTLIRHTGSPCITILCPSSRTIPDAFQVPIRLKVLYRETEQRLRQEYDDAIATPLLARLRAAMDAIDERHLLEGFALLVDRTVSEKFDLPFDVKERIVIDRTFATREIIRANLTSLAYYVLVLTLEKAYLLEAYTDRVVHEQFMGFPITNDYSGNSHLNTMAGVQIEQPKQFWNDVDKAVLGVAGQHGHVVVACVAEHYTPYLQIANKPGIYIGNMPGNKDHATPHDIVKEAWKVAYAHQSKMHAAEVEKLSRASVGMTSTDIGDIWRRILEGRGHLLLVERDLRQPALVEEGRVRLVDDPNTTNTVDDLVDDIIEQQLKHGGEVRVLPNGSLEEFGGIALMLRY
jgi:hypothetical protein